MIDENHRESLAQVASVFIVRTLNASRNADIALVGIGSLIPLNSRYVQAGFISAQVLLELEKEGVVGDIGGQFFTQPGELHPCKYNQCMISLSLEEMQQIPNTIAVAMGKDKVKAILGGLHTGVIDVLCTEYSTAREVLDLEFTASSPGSASITTCYLNNVL